MLRTIKGASLALLLSTLFVTGARGQGTYTAASCSQSAVNAVINGPTHTAVNGDTINLPSGTCTWTTGVTVPSGIGITISGTGTPQSGASTTGASSSCTATVITDDLTSGGNIFLLQPTSGSSLSRISCMKIVAQSGMGTNSITSPVAVQGTCNSSTCPNLRIDNVTFDGSFQGTISNSDTVMVTDNVFGVLDHNSMSGTAGGCLFEFVNYNNSAWAGTGAYGDNSWASADSFGTPQALYEENNAFGAQVIPGETESAVPNGGMGGGRIVSRFNTCTSCYVGVANHGTESDGRPRGGRQIEYYGNTFVCGTGSSCGGGNGVGIRSGIAYVFGNSFTVSNGSWFNGYLSFADYRTLQYFTPWGGCNGTGSWDDNGGTVYYSGTIQGLSTSGETATITDSTKSWSVSQLVPTGAPYAIHDVTTNTGAQITANTSTTVSASGWTGPPNFNAGDSYQILRAMVCIDQPNRSGGTLLSGSTPSPTGWVNESLDPSYEWDDSGYSPVFGNVSSGAGQMIANRDWYTDNSKGAPQAQTSSTSPFNGSSGVGFGTLANRPTNCTPHVAYWATDQGSWNASGNSFGQGELFVCTATDTWTLQYTPYTYPHPLTNPDPGSQLAPPSNVQAVAH